MNQNDTYDNLSLQSNTVSIHQRHLRFFSDTVYKSMSQLNPEFMWSYFTHKDMPYSLRKSPTFGLFILLWYECRAVHFRGSLICNNLPEVLKYMIYEVLFYFVI